MKDTQREKVLRDDKKKVCDACVPREGGREARGEKGEREGEEEPYPAPANGMTDLGMTDQ